jgi:mono/diheme cytochrome c family protein
MPDTRAVPRRSKRTRPTHSSMGGVSLRTVNLNHAMRFLAPITALIAALAGQVQAAEQSLGAYLATVGNCKSCHTTADGQAYAGGLRFETPFGTLYSTNITPDPETGIGSWTLEDFDRALRHGLRPDGEHLYPVFPYTAFAKLKDADVAALFDYLQTLTPVSRQATANEMSFPFDQRWALGLWKWLYLDEGSFEEDPEQSAAWNRGAYLVEGLGHCGMCHTPRDFLGGQDMDLAYTGATHQGLLEGKWLDWSSTNLTAASSGLGAWSAEELVSYLKYGVSAQAGIFGPMNEVVVNSTRHMSDEDLEAMAVYLKSLPANEQSPGPEPDQETMRQGELLYDIHCGTCHLPSGLGSDSTGPPLLGSSVTLASDPASLINVTLYGPDSPREPPSEKWQMREWQPMKAYNDILDDEETAALLTYTRSAWGNGAGTVTVEQVEKQR